MIVTTSPAKAGLFFFPSPGSRAARFRARAMIALSALSLTAICASCAACGARPGGRVSVASYNAMAFFDGKDDGPEYSGYRVSEGDWGPEPYRRRLEKLKEALLACSPGGPDLACLVEIENQGVLSDLSALMKASGYAYSGFAGGAGSTGCAVLSRLPLLGLKAHVPSAPNGPGGGSPFRPILEARVDLRGSAAFVFVNHWKSKLGGAEETEGQRVASAVLLAQLMSERMAAYPEAACLACGDMNEDIEEWEKCGSAYQTALGTLSAGPALCAPPGGSPILLAGLPGSLPASFPDGLPGGREDRAALVALSPWLFPGNEEEWSYWFDGRGERIDHFFLSPSLFDGEGWDYADFRVVADELLLDGSGRPRKWDSRTKQGYSDHLPILIELSPPGT